MISLMRCGAIIVPMIILLYQAKGDDYCQAKE
jgi:hypothetical protein